MCVFFPPWCRWSVHPDTQMGCPEPEPKAANRDVEVKEIPPPVPQPHGRLRMDALVIRSGWSTQFGPRGRNDVQIAQVLSCCVAFWSGGNLKTRKPDCFEVKHLGAGWYVEGCTTLHNAKKTCCSVLLSVALCSLYSVLVSQVFCLLPSMPLFPRTPRVPHTYSTRTTGPRPIQDLDAVGGRHGRG